MARVNREHLLSCLDSAAVGLSPHPVVEQSDMFAFANKRVMAFNDEVACRGPSPLNGIHGAVAAHAFLELLRRMNEEEVEVEQQETQLIVRGKGGRKAGIRMESRVALPIDTVEEPKKWKKLPADFCDAVKITYQCVGKDEAHFQLTCVHVTPDVIEACNNYQMCRWPMETGFNLDSLIRGSAMKHLPEVGVTEFSESSKWIHFRNANDFTFSCRRYEAAGEYPDMEPFMQLEDGVKTSLPKTLEKAVEKAAVFSGENPDNNQLLVVIRNGKLRLRGEGVSGWYTEPKTIEWNGPDMEFRAPPDLLIDVVKRFNSVKIGAGKLLVETGAYSYASCLNDVEEQEQEESGQ